MALDISKNFDVALRILRENPAIFIPSLASLLISASILALSIGLFFYSTGASFSAEAVLSNLSLALFIALLDFFLVLAVSAWFDSVSLYMVRQAWTRGNVDVDDCFSRGGRYALSIFGVDLAFSASMLIFGTGVFVPLLFGGFLSTVLSLFSLFFLALSFLFLYWRKESVVLKGGASDAILFSQDFFGRNASGTFLLIAFIFLFGFAIDFFGDALSQVLVAGLKYLGAPIFFGDAVALAVLFTSTLLYGVLARAIKLCVFLDANRKK